MGFVLIVGGGGRAGRSWTARAEDGAVVRVGVGGGGWTNAIGLDGSHHDEEGDRKLHGCWSLRVCAKRSRAGVV